MSSKPDYKPINYSHAPTSQFTSNLNSVETRGAMNTKAGVMDNDSKSEKSYMTSKESERKEDKKMQEDDYINSIISSVGEYLQVDSLKQQDDVVMHDYLFVDDNKLRYYVLYENGLIEYYKQASNQKTQCL